MTIRITTTTNPNSQPAVAVVTEPSNGLDVETIEERLQWIIEQRGLPSLRQLALRAGLSHSTLAAVVHRERKTGKAALETATCLAIAKATGVSATWLASGRGAPYEGLPVPPPPETPQRLEPTEEAIEALIEDGVPEARAYEIVGALSLRLRSRSPGGVALYRLALRTWHAEQGRPLPGDRDVTLPKKR